MTNRPDPTEAWALSRLLVGETPNGELQALREPIRSMADRLANVKVDDALTGLARKEALARERGPLWETMLTARPADRDALVKALADADPSGPPPEAGSNDDREGLSTTCLADIKPVPIRWLVPGVLPLGKLVILAGEGGHGKTTITLDLAACSSRGWCSLGLPYDPPAPSDVLLISCEDDYGDTVVPRLLSAGADLNRIHRVDGLAVGEGRPRAFTMAHLEFLEVELERRPDVRLVIIDPVGGYVGRAGVNDNREAELRVVLDPLAEMAARRSVLVLMVKHLSKDQTRKAAQRVGGSAAYVNSPRAAFVAVPDPDTSERRLFLPIKFNCGPWPSGLAYTMEPLALEEQAGILATMDHLGQEDRDRLAKQLYRVAWQGPVSITADEALAADARMDRHGKAESDRAADWLRDRLAVGPAGSNLCAMEGDRFLGKPWPPPGDDPDKAANGRMRWWRESILKPRLGGKPRKLGMNGPWCFTLPDSPWPPSGEVIMTARDAETNAPPEGPAPAFEAPEAPEAPEESEAPDSRKTDSSKRRRSARCTDTDSSGASGASGASKKHRGKRPRAGGTRVS